MTTATWTAVALLAAVSPASGVRGSALRTLARGPHGRAAMPAARSVKRASAACVRMDDGAPATAEALDLWLQATGRDSTPLQMSAAVDMIGALADFWAQVCTTSDSPFDERALAFPALSADKALFAKLVHHINTCSEVCETLGQDVFVATRHPANEPEGEPPAPCPILLLRKPSGDGYGFNADDDAFWDDFPDNFGAELGVEEGEAGPASDEEVLKETRKWVEAVICHMGVCPFSSTADRAGLPPGGVEYPITREATADAIYLEFWAQVERLLDTDERTLSTILLLTPEFCLHSAGGFDALADTLNEALSLLGVESEIQLVFFHPEYTFRDGKARAGGDDEAANFARRSPFPMINLLRTPQVRAAQKGIPTGSVYAVNERNMASVGTNELKRMLDDRDWAPVYDRTDFEQHAGREG